MINYNILYWWKVKECGLSALNSLLAVSQFCLDSSKAPLSLPCRHRVPLGYGLLMWFHRYVYVVLCAGSGAPDQLCPPPQEHVAQSQPNRTNNGEYCLTSGATATLLHSPEIMLEIDATVFPFRFGNLCLLWFSYIVVFSYVDVKSLNETELR